MEFVPSASPGARASIGVAQAEAWNQLHSGYNDYGLPRFKKIHMTDDYIYYPYLYWIQSYGTLLNPNELKKFNIYLLLELTNPIKKIKIIEITNNIIYAEDIFTKELIEIPKSLITINKQQIKNYTFYNLENAIGGKRKFKKTRKNMKNKRKTRKYKKIQKNSKTTLRNISKDH